MKKEDCVGCNACVQRCPVQCIGMNEDKQGFLYPIVNQDKCIDCGLCERVCPVINQAEPRKPNLTYAAWNPDDEVRMSSSSGGVFFALAMKIIEEGGVVFGARFNDKWEVVHDYAETLEGVKAFQGSKYVQSRIGNSFNDAERFLKEGRKVMFTGTPCQLAGLRLFLRKDYREQLLKVDVVCHGVPSPLVWREYLATLLRPKGAETGKNTVSSSLNTISHIRDISFRDKRMGWEKYGFAVCRNGESTVLYEPMRKNIYMQGFLKNLYLRPSCYECPVKCGKSHSDLTLADFWHIKELYPHLYDKHGISLVMANTHIGEFLLSSININKSQTTYEIALSSNSSIEKSVSKPKYYHIFWSIYGDLGIETISYIVNKMKPSFIRRILKKGKALMDKSFR